MSQTDELLINARSYESGHRDVELGPRPSRRVAVLACMDTRLNPYALLGLGEGEAHMIRNAGGIVTDDAIRSLAISQNVLGTEEVILIQHTDCGLLGVSDAELADRVEAASGSRPTWHFHAFSDLEQSVREGIELIRSSPFLPRREGVRGFVFEVDTGRLREVSP
jgi:carbonic anhydrase